MTARQRFAYVLAMCLVIVVAAGGAAGKSAPSRVAPASTDPDPVYLKSSPYNRLYVEVDTVEGANVDPRWLTQLKAFLVQYGNKPGGVRLVRGKTIPLSQVKGLSPNEIAGMNIEGPPAGSDTRHTAFIYVLFYDSRKLGARKPDNPHVSYADYPCAIYFDTAYARGAQQAFAVNALRHEAGHVLGLCKNRSHGDGSHCRDPHCLMYPTLMLPPKWFCRPTPQKELCAACRKDLQAGQSSRGDPRFSFAGPVLVRHEKDYWVMSAPGLVSLVFDSREAADWRGMLLQYRQWLRQRPGGSSRGIYAVWQIQAQGTSGVSHLKTALADARRDTSPLVQSAARDAQLRLDKDLAKKTRSKSPAGALASAKKRAGGKPQAAATVQ